MTFCDYQVNRQIGAFLSGTKLIAHEVIRLVKIADVLEGSLKQSHVKQI